ncbi:MAG: ComEC family competence protein, partial [Muribaculaceae bacterium]|nr:ComEC family competence protein [Muribaculaceae bacterium]
MALGCRWLAGDLAVIALASLAAGVVAGAMGSPSQLSGDYALQRLCWQGKVVDVAETDGARRLTVDIDRVSGCSSGDRSACVELRASLIVPSLFPIVDAGDRVVAQLVLEPIADMRDLPDEIDYGDYMRRNGISAHGVVSPDDIAVVSKAGGIAGLAGRIRRNIISLIASSSVDDGTGALMSALLVGDRDMLPDATRAAYSAAGLAHILAVSGLHVGIIAAIAVFILWPMRLTRCNRLRILMTILIVWCYAIISGMSPSAVRAALMASVFLGAGLFGRNSSSLNSLCLAGLIILACDPMSVKSIGFQLSFAAVAAIILLVPVINRVDRREHPVVWHIASAVTVPVAAMVGSGAIAAYYFHSFPVYFLAANIASAFMAGPL